MAYAKKTWALDDPITDVALNNIETGVDAAHDVLDATGTPTGLSAATANAIGTATAKAKADHTHTILANGTPSTQTMGDTAVVGTSAALARADHKHAMPPFAKCGTGIYTVYGNQVTANTVNFSYTFPSTPVVVVTETDGDGDNRITRVYDITTTGFKVGGVGSGINYTINFNWIAMINP
jgi:hypothetical protein